MKALELASLLPSPSVRFPLDFARRLAAFVARERASDRWEGRGRGALFGAGEDLVGHRPYRPGDDPRRIDWNAFARLGRPFVSVARRESSERWTVLLDASASMGVGVPGKLQRAAEVAAAVAAAGLRARARVRLLASGGRALELAGKSSVPRLLQFLEATRAEGSAGPAALFEAAAHGRSGVRSGTTVALGDFFELDPQSLARSARPGRELALGWILAPHELAPSAEASDGALEWIDPETGERARVRADLATRAAYERALARELERWRELCARHRVRFGAFASTAPFEQIARAVLPP